MSVLKKKAIGNTNLKVSELGFGAASIGNLYKAISDDEAKSTIQAAIASGINLFDTAPRYGLGLSERRLGDVLRTFDRSDYVVSTKVGRILKPDISAKVHELRYGFETPMPFDSHYDYSYDGIMRSFEDSLQRLGLAELDILLVHDLGRDEHGINDRHYFEQFTQSGYKALESLRQQRVIQAVGLGVNETEICERVMEFGQFDCFLLAGRYTLLEQGGLQQFLPKCESHGASIILGAPYNSGILATGSKGQDKPLSNYGPTSEHIISNVAQIEMVCEAFNVSLPAAALQFPLAHPCVASVIPGIGNESRMNKTKALFEQAIPTEFWLKLKTLGLIDEAAPIPSGS